MPEIKHATKHEQRHENIFPKVKVPKMMSPFQGFVDFIREQGVIGLAIGIVLGAQIKSLVDSFVLSFVNPVIGLVLPGGGDLAQKTLRVSNGGKVSVFLWGAFLTQLISFVMVAAIIYYTVKGLKLDKLDKKKKDDK